MSFHVIVIGGGIGGLCLAQGLRKAGMSVTVYERDQTPTARLQGYRIHINPDGSRALHACLPSHLYETFVATCGKSGNGFTFYTKKMEELLHLQVLEDGEELDPVESHKSVSRITLRQVLLAEMDEIVHFNKKFIRYEEREDGKITAHFEDGTSATGDVLVAADGGNSRVRQQFLPHAKRVDTGIRAIAGKAPLTDEVRALLPHHLFTGAATVIAPKGVGMFIAVQEFSHDRDFLMNSIGGNDVSFTEESGILFDNTKDYVMWALTGRREKFPVREELNELEPSELQQAALTMTDEWGDRLRKLIQLTDTRTITPLQIQSSIPIEHWETKRITLIGDAIHSMTPFRGIGANVALRDAQLLCTNLTAAHRGEKKLIQAIHDYEKEMIQYGFDAVRSSLKQADQSVSENVIGLWMMKTAFRFLNAVPPLKRLAFRGFGEQ